MNYHIFADFGAGYTQLVNDHTRGLLVDSLKFAKDMHQLIIHRDDNKMYYIYIRKISNNQFMGFCLDTYNEYMENPKKYMLIHEDILSGMAKKGIFCKYKKGEENIIGNKVTFDNNLGEAYQLLIEYENKISALHLDFNPLPPKDYEIPEDSYVTFSYSDPTSDILPASRRFPYTIIYRRDNFKYGYVDSVQKTIDDLKAKIKELESNKGKNNISSHNNNKWIIATGILSGLVILSVCYFLYFIYSDPTVTYKFNQFFPLK